MSKEEKADIRKHGPITEFRPDDDRISGGKDGSVQKEALGAEGIDNLSATSASSGGAASGQIETIEANPTPKRHGASEPGNRGGITR
jgi:hypothetical protein